MGCSSSKYAIEDQEQNEKAIKQKSLEAKALLEVKYKEYEVLYNAKFKQSKYLEEEAKKKLKAGNKDGARSILSKKKKLQKELDNINNRLTFLDDQIMALDNADNLGSISKTIKKAGSVLKKEKVNIGELEDERDKLRDLKENHAEFNKVFEDYHNEINDDDELEEELEKCQKEIENEAKLPSANKENLNDKVKNPNLKKELYKISV